MYHREVITIKAGAMTASHIPNRVRTAMIEAVPRHAAEQQRMMPQRKMLYPKTFETENRRRSIPARRSSASDNSCRFDILTLRQFSHDVADEEGCCRPRKILTLHMKVFLQSHDVGILRCSLFSSVMCHCKSMISHIDSHLVQELQEVCKEEGGDDPPIDFADQSCFSTIVRLSAIR